MKKFFAWLLRFLCFAVIGVAAFTLIQCLQHINDDYSAETIMGTTEIKTFESENYTTDSTPVQEMEVVEAVEENPTVLLSTDGSATVNRPTVTVTAAFGSIINSVVADLSWYLDDTLVREDEDCLLVEGSTMSHDLRIRVTADSAETAEVKLVVNYQEKTVEATAEITVELPDEEAGVVIRTQEIPVTAKRDTEICRDSELENATDAVMAEDETGLLLDYQTDNSGLVALQLQFTDGTAGWVDADDVEISEENCTTDEDYTPGQKEEFVDSMKYDSDTSHLIWVSLYTQKVNIFSGYRGNWTLEESFDCATGRNDSPTTRGIYSIEYTDDKWELGATYVSPVMIFNGGEAFTSQPYDTETDEIADDTMGEPASAGGVRLLAEDIRWMIDNINDNTTVVVY